MNIIRATGLLSESGVRCWNWFVTRGNREEANRLGSMLVKLHNWKGERPFLFLGGPRYDCNQFEFLGPLGTKNIMDLAELLLLVLLRLRHQVFKAIAVKCIFFFIC